MPPAKSSICRKDANGEWDIHLLGRAHDIKVYANKDRAAGPVAVADIGSNSVKLVVFDTSTSVPRVLDQHSQQCGLGKDMVADDLNPRLNKEALRVIRKDVLPKWKKILSRLETPPNAHIITASEAMRAASKNKDNPDQIKIAEDLLVDIANGIDVPRKAINIISEKQEACLTGHAMMCGGHSGYGIMIGGNSSEFVKVKNGKTLRHATLRFGMQSLLGEAHAARIIKNGFDSIPWFSDTNGADAKRSTRLCVLGGTPRAAGREAAEVIDRIPYSARMPFGGYTFEGGWELQSFMDELKHATRERLFINSFGASKDEITRTACKIEGETSLQITRRGKGKETMKIWVSSDDFDTMKDEWHEKIGSRADLFPGFAHILLEAEKRLRPRTVNFSPHNMREGVLRYTGLGYT